MNWLFNISLGLCLRWMFIVCCCCLFDYDCLCVSGCYLVVDSWYCLFGLVLVLGGMCLVILFACSSVYVCFV